MVIAFAGKGSSGKSTVVAEIVRQYRRNGAQARLLVVDADPHQSLSTLLGITPDNTLGSLRTTAEAVLGSDVQESRTERVERALVTQALMSLPGFDFLALGQWGLAGSQCTTNRVLGYAFDRLLPQYDLVLIDHEAGLEPIGRFAHHPLNHLVIVATHELLNLHVARRILAYARSLHRPITTVGLVFNRTSAAHPSVPEARTLVQQLLTQQVRYLGSLPEDPTIQTHVGLHIRQPSAPDAPYQRAMMDIMTKLGL